MTFRARSIALAAVALIAALGPAASAEAAGTTSTTSTTPTAPAPAAHATPSLFTAGTFAVSGGPVTVPGRAVDVTGVVRPYVVGQRVLLQAFDNGKLFKSTLLSLKPSKRKVDGQFTYAVRAPNAGQVKIVVKHTANASLTGFERQLGYAALTETGPGSTGRFVELVQSRLLALHFYIPQTGVYDQGTELAVDAYHRLLGWGYAQTLGPASVTALLNGQGAFHVRFPGQGNHAEGDLSDQLLALIHGSNVSEIFPISSGKPSTPTVLGSWQIYRRTPGYLPDGMYYSSFFTGGYAIHGYDPAPDYPASHGCMRLPIVDAIPAFNWLTYGDWVDTYYT